jgi:hypothetical protein
LLTKEELKSFAADYRETNKDFVLVPVDAAAIVEATKSWGKNSSGICFWLLS